MVNSQRHTVLLNTVEEDTFSSVNHDSNKISKDWCRYFKKHKCLLFHESCWEDKALFIVITIYKKIKPLLLPSSSHTLRLGIFVLIKHSSTVTTQSSRPFMKSSLLLENNDQGADTNLCGRVDIWRLQFRFHFLYFLLFVRLVCNLHLQHEAPEHLQMGLPNSLASAQVSSVSIFIIEVFELGLQAVMWFLSCVELRKAGNAIKIGLRALPGEIQSLWFSYRGFHRVSQYSEMTKSSWVQK